MIILGVALLIAIIIGLSFTNMKTFNFKKMILVLSIVIVLNLFFNYGIFTFYKSPNYEDFCGPDKVNKASNNEAECKANGGFWNISGGAKYPEGVDCTTMDGRPALCKPISSEGYCDMQYYCQKNLNEVRSVYNRNVFLALIVAGIVSIVGGFFFSISEVVSLGFSYGGVLSLIIGSIRYWSDMDDYLRFIILGIALAILVWLGVKKFRNENKNEGV